MRFNRKPMTDNRLQTHNMKGLLFVNEDWSKHIQDSYVCLNNDKTMKFRLLSKAQEIFVRRFLHVHALE